MLEDRAGSFVGPLTANSEEDHMWARVTTTHGDPAARDLGDRRYEADTLTRLGDTHHAIGNTGDAREVWQQALTVLDQLDHPDADEVRVKQKKQEST